MESKPEEIYPFFFFLLFNFFLSTLPVLPEQIAHLILSVRNVLLCFDEQGFSNFSFEYNDIVQFCISEGESEL